MTETELVQYVSDMSQQLAALAREQLPNVAKVLEIAAELAQDALAPTR